MEDERLYSDDEVKALLGRAVELSRQGAGRGSRRQGTALPELERIAAEVGLPADSLRRAAAELAVKKPAGEAAPLRSFLHAERHEMAIRIARLPSDQELARILLVLPDLVGLPGAGTAANGGLLWRSGNEQPDKPRPGISVRVEIRPEPGEGGGAVAELRLEADDAAGGIYGGIMGGLGLGAGLGAGLGVGLGALHSAAFATLVPIACLGLSFLLSRGIMKAYSSWVRKKAERLSEELRRRLGGA